MYKFETNQEIEEILNNSKDKTKAVEAAEFVYELTLKESLTIEDYRWQMLINHVTAMVNRAVTGETLQDIDKALFEEIGQDSVDMAEKVVNFIGGLKEDEKYLLSVHFESSKIN